MLPDPRRCEICSRQNPTSVGVVVRHCSEAYQPVGERPSFPSMVQLRLYEHERLAEPNFPQTCHAHSNHDSGHYFPLDVPSGNTYPLSVQPKRELNVNRS